MNDPYRPRDRTPIDLAALAEFNAGTRFAALAYDHEHTHRHRLQGPHRQREAAAAPGAEEGDPMSASSEQSTESAQPCTCTDPAAACPSCLALRDRNGWPKDWQERMRDGWHDLLRPGDDCGGAPDWCLAPNGVECGQHDEKAQHLVRVQHDPESHEYDCHDDCTAKVICNGVTEACRVWWECERCQKVLARLDSNGKDEYHERLYERGEAHGRDHEHINGAWMTPGRQCLSAACEEDDALDLVPELPDGDHPVSIDWEEGYLMVRPAQSANPLPPGQGESA